MARTLGTPRESSPHQLQLAEQRAASLTAAAAEAAHTPHAQADDLGRRAVDGVPTQGEAEAVPAEAKPTPDGRGSGAGPEDQSQLLEPTPLAGAGVSPQLHPGTQPSHSPTAPSSARGLPTSAQARATAQSPSRATPRLQPRQLNLKIRHSSSRRPLQVQRSPKASTAQPSLGSQLQSQASTAQLSPASVPSPGTQSHSSELSSLLTPLLTQARAQPPPRGTPRRWPWRRSLNQLNSNLKRPSRSGKLAAAPRARSTRNKIEVKSGPPPKSHLKIGPQPMSHLKFPTEPSLGRRSGRTAATPSSSSSPATAQPSPRSLASCARSGSTSSSSTS